MLKLKLILLIILFSKKIKTLCKEGCLKCNIKTKDCLICDTLKSYKLEKKNCIKKKIKNCQIQNLSGNCLKCFGNYNLEKSTKKCIKIPEQKKISNCFSYDENQICINCMPYFILKKNKCVNVQIEIENCEFYKSDNECISCFEDFTLSFDKKKCLDNFLLYKIKGCRNLSNVYCKKCKIGFVQNFSFFNKNFFNFYNLYSKNLILKNMRKVFLNRKSFIYFNSCVKTPVQNCEIFSDFENCEICENNYFLQNNKCLEYKNFVIDFCEVYKDKKNCEKCKEDYFLKNNKCLEILKIDNCKIYDNSFFLSRCLECFDKYYLLQNKCLLRKLSIDNFIKHCKKKDLTLDACKECEDGFFLSSDGLKCFFKLINCIIHKSIMEYENEIACEKCENGYYLNEKFFCEVGQIENCGIYENFSQTCEKCLNSFFFKNNQCIAHQNIPNCQLYSSQKEYLCDKCNKNFLNFHIEKLCIDFQKVENCLKYKQDGESGCLECELGYIQQNYICKKIENQNCAKFDFNLNKCIFCFKNYALDSINNCLENHDYLKFTCEQTNISNQLFVPKKIKEIKCELCSENYFPVLKDKFICVKNDYLQFEDIYEVENCLQYDVEKNCVLCKENYFLFKNSFGYICTSNCLQFKDNFLFEKIKVIEKIKDDKKFYEIKSVNNCVRKSFDCRTKVPDISKNLLNLICISCVKENTIKLTNFEYPLFSNINPMVKNFIDSPFSFFPEITCENNYDENDLINNCEYYMKKNELLECLKCEKGFTGIISQNGLISECIKMEKCSEKKILNLHPIFQKITSCYKCKETNEIPFLAINFDENFNIKTYSQYNLSSSDWNDINILPKKNTIHCLEQNSLNFGYNSSNENLFQFPLNCGLGIINLSQKNNNTLDNKSQKIDNLALFCTSCLPGYKTIKNDNYNFIKINCEKINNCKGQDWFDFCSECEIGFNFLFSDNKVIFDECVKSEDIYCYAFDQILNKCGICKKGFFLDPDGICRKDAIFKCQAFGDFFDMEFESFYYQVFLNPFGKGCYQCEDLFSSIEKNEEINCIKIEGENNFLKNTYRIENCKNYFFEEGEYKCFFCKENFILDSQKKNCVKKKMDLENCVLIDENKKCLECKQDFALVNNLCYKGNIENCEIHNFNKNNNSQKCLDCKKGFYLTFNNTCFEGKVKNCENYFTNNPIKCEKCQNSYFLLKGITLDNCIKIEKDLNCKNIEFINKEGFLASLSCIKCKEKNQRILKYEEINKNLDFKYNSICLENELVENCKDFIITQEFNEIDIKCENCKENFFFNFSKCEERKNLDKNCFHLNPKKDQCLKCKDEFFLNDNFICENNPFGIENCLIYKNIDFCLKCKKKMFLKNNRCFFIEKKNEILNCEFYKDELTCKFCKKDFFLENNICLKSTITNCLIYENISSCKKCKEEYYIKEKNCVKIKKENCIKIDYKNLNHPCIQCEKNYYYDSLNKKCKILKNQIENCHIQENEKICSICKTEFILTKNKENCINKDISFLIDPNCENSAILEPFCTICDSGYFLVYNKNNNNDDNNFITSCEKCKGDVSNCFYCDEDSEGCIICNSGFYMDFEGICREVVEVEEDVKVESRLMLFKVFLAFFLVLIN